MTYSFDIKFSEQISSSKKSDAGTLLLTTAMKKTRYLTGQMDCAK